MIGGEIVGDLQIVAIVGGFLLGEEGSASACVV